MTNNLLPNRPPTFTQALLLFLGCLAGEHFFANKRCLFNPVPNGCKISINVLCTGLALLLVLARALMLGCLLRRGTGPCTTTYVGTCAGHRSLPSLRYKLQPSSNRGYKAGKTTEERVRERERHTQRERYVVRQ